MKNLIKLVALMMSVLMVFSLTACKNSPDEEYSTYSEVIWIDDDTSSEDDTANSGADTTNSGDQSGTQSDQGSTQSGTQSDQGSTQPGTADKNDISKLRGTTVDVLWWIEPSADELKMFKNFESKYGIKVNVIQTTDTEYNTKLSNMIVAKEGLDVANVQNFPFTAQKCFQNITVTGINPKYSYWNQQVSDRYSIKGKTYAVASNKGIWYNTFDLLFFDEDIFIANGITTPRELWEKGNWNWDTFYDIAVQLHKADPEIGILVGTESPFMDVLGTDFVVFDGKSYKNTSTSANVIKAWQQSAKFLDAGLFSNVTVGDSFSFDKGNLAMKLTNSWGARKEIYGKVPGTLDAVPFPGPKGADAKINFTPRVFGCPKGSDNALAAGLFIEYVTNPSNYPASLEKSCINKNLVKTIEWVLNNTDKYYLEGNGNIIGYTISTRNRGALTYKLTRTASAQITTVLNEFKSSIDGSVKAANKIVE